MRLAALIVALALAAPATRASADAAPAAGAAATAGVGVGAVNINTASVDELVRLPGVGPAKAAAIAAFRGKHGPFKRIEDLDRVKGFGRKLLGRVRPFVALSGPTTYVGKPGSTKNSTKLESPRAD
jgi:competence protein ComEA